MTVHALPMLRQVTRPVTALMIATALGGCVVYPYTADPVGYRVGAAYPGYYGQVPYGAERTADHRDLDGYR